MLRQFSPVFFLHSGLFCTNKCKLPSPVIMKLQCGQECWELRIRQFVHWMCVCVWKPWSHRSPLGVNTQGATGAPKERWPTKTSSGTRENVPAKLVTCCSHCCLLSWWFMWGRRFVDTMLPSAFLTSFFRLQDSPVLISSQSGNQASNVVH